MGWGNHPRNITDYQPQDGCVIDAMSLEDAMKDIEEWINNIPERSVKTRWLSNTGVAGWSPASQYSGWDGTASASTGATATQREYPFLRQLNCDADKVGVFSPRSYMNPQRVKGTKAPGIESGNEDSFQNDNYQLIWTTPLIFPKPTVFRTIDLIMRVDALHTNREGGYNNSFSYENSRIPLGYTQYSPMENMSLVVHVDHPVSTEQRKLNDSEIAIHNVQTAVGEATGSINFRRRSVSAIPMPATGFTDMSPSTAAGSLEGIKISEEVNIPLCPGARVRIAVVIPATRTGAASSLAGWGTSTAMETPQLLQQWNLSYTWLEALS